MTDICGKLFIIFALLGISFATENETNWKNIEKMLKQIMETQENFIAKYQETAIDLMIIKEEIKQQVMNISIDLDYVKDTVQSLNESVSVILKDSSDTDKPIVSSLYGNIDGGLTQQVPSYVPFKEGMNGLTVPVHGEEIPYISFNSEIGPSYSHNNNNNNNSFHVEQVSFHLLQNGSFAGPCDFGYELVGDKCILISTYELTLPEAMQYCHAVKGKLFELSSANQYAAVVAHIRNVIDYASLNFWVDGTDENEEGTWIASSGTPVPMGTPFWAASGTSHQEPNGGERENCLEIQSSTNFQVVDISCDMKKNVICERPSKLVVPARMKSVECPMYYVNVGGKCLSFLTWKKENWEQAEATCVEYHGQLAAIHDADLLREVYLYIHANELSSHSFWTGGSDSCKEGTWIWIDRTNVPQGSPFWGKGSKAFEPDGGDTENCLGLVSRGFYFFRDVSCNDLFSPLCQYIGSE